MRLVFAGTPAAALPSLAAIAASDHEVVGVVTRPDAPVGRGRRLAPSPVAEAASALGIQAVKPVSSRDPDFLAWLRSLAPNCCPVVAYGGLLPRQALEIPPSGWVNLHFSLLPAWRGAAPVQRSILAGDEVTGATTFRLVEELDAGPTYGLLTETIKPDDTAGSLLARLAQHGADLLVATLDGIEDGSLDQRAQLETGLSWAPKLSTEDAEIRWDAPAVAVDRQVRACTPSPGAWTVIAGQRCKVGPVSLPPNSDSLPAGHLRITKSAVLVGTATQLVELGEVRPAGKPAMRAADWARGLREVPGKVGS